MKDSDQDSKRIPKEQMTAWERWELPPLLDERGNQVVEEEEVKPLTAADLEEIRQAAREDGFQEGRQAGYAEGFEQGRADGHKDGYAAGEAEGGRSEGEQQAAEQTRQEVASRMERLEHLMGELLLPIERHEDELEAVLVNLTTVLARAVVFRELSIDSSQIRQVVRRALSSLPLPPIIYAFIFTPPTISSRYGKSQSAWNHRRSSLRTTLSCLVAVKWNRAIVWWITPWRSASSGWFRVCWKNSWRSLPVRIRRSWHQYGGGADRFSPGCAE